MEAVLVRCLFALTLGASMPTQGIPAQEIPSQEIPSQEIPAQDGPPPLAPAIDPTPVLDTTTFATHWQHIVPAADELQWRDIPWLGTLADAVEQAHAQDKPILLWAMNGHPLACT